MPARVRRFSPPGSRAGSGPAKAAWISRRLTSSQWQTIRHGPEPPSRVRGARRDWACAAMTGSSGLIDAGGAAAAKDVAGQAQGGREAGRADPADCQPVAIGLVPDAVFLAVGRRSKPGIGRRHRNTGQGGHHLDSAGDQCSSVPAPRSPARDRLLLGRGSHQQVAEHRPGQHTPLVRSLGTAAGCVVRSSWAAGLSNTTNWPLRGCIADFGAARAAAAQR